MPNIKFNYLYRDAANYKKYGFVILSNHDGFELLEIEKLIRSKLIWGEWFYADEWGLPELFLETVDFRIDPTWHEFECFEYTNVAGDEFMTIKTLKTLLEKTNRQY
ncbi:hypothetical protein KXD93_09640 [Mucilaginibacter sp. BJC16-A38]|uniref:hypothetical protein n=1 Tax=Mucilaginibacter phenanthrenivorans TaxID=1234842 RepID=UPI002157A1F8|nr:hypothetical protein [Mucilaginibacter phenanthrenivorans]MCR8557904.1 hypothetical protein [Mucilaginibacter phenanthrenivorans]